MKNYKIAVAGTGYLKAVERLRKTAEQLSRQERDKSHDRGPER